MKVLVAGGTGFVGSHIVRALLESMSDVSVRILSRRAQTCNPWDARIEFIQGSVTVPPTLHRAVSHVDAVINCVQFHNNPVQNPAKGWTYREVDALGTRNLVEACKQAGTRRFIYISSAGVAPDRAEPWLRAKSFAEHAVRTSGMEFVILRPTWIYGPGDRTLNRLARSARLLPIVFIIGNGRHLVQPVSVFDVAHCAAVCLRKADAANRVFDLGGPEQLTRDEVIRRFLRATNRQAHLVHMPISVVKLIAGFLSMLPNSPLSTQAVDLFLAENAVDRRPAEEFFGIRFEDLETGLRRYLNA